MKSFRWIKITLVVFAWSLGLGWGKVGLANSPTAVLADPVGLPEVHANRPEVVAAERPQINSPEDAEGNSDNPPGNTNQEAPENSIDTNAAEGSSGCSFLATRGGDHGSAKDALSFPLFAALALLLPRFKRQAKGQD